MELKFNIFYAPTVLPDLDGIADYIANTLCAPQAAEKLIGKILHRIQRLADFPFSGTMLDDTSAELTFAYRWLKVDNYMIFYTVDETAQAVTVMRVLYDASDYLSIL